LLPSSTVLKGLKQEVLEANFMLVAEGLVKLTWGNVSGIDRDRGLMVIKPSGIPYAELSPEKLVIVDLEGKVVDSHYRPSSDTPTHLVLYREFPEIGGITHTHSPYAVMFCQAGLALPCQGTTHADHFYGEVPLVRELTPKEVEAGYEVNTGLAIVERFRELGLKPMEMPAALQRFHAPFTWGKSAIDSVNNSVALEVCCQMAMGALQLNPGTPGLPEHLLNKHYLRKHGAGAYYGQKGS